MTWAEGVKKITRDPALRLNLADKCLVKTGFCADLVVFDSEIINALEHYSNPSAFPIGLHYTLVNGHVTVANGEILSTSAGKLI